MLFRTILSDLSLNPVLGKEDLLYNSLTRFLRDVRKTGVILVDEDKEIIDRFFSAINHWHELENFPQGSQCAIDLKKLLLILQKENRLVFVSEKEHLESDCKTEFCLLYLDMAKTQNPEFIVVPDKCFECTSQSLSLLDTSKVLCIDSFDHDEAFRKYADRRGIEVQGWNQYEFESKVLIPLFRCTENVFLLDRQFGKYFVSNSGYKATIKWILEVFMRTSNPFSRGVFEIHTKKVDDQNIIKEFEKNMQSLHPRFRVVFDSHNKHDRFLLTDQVKLGIGQGFDLLVDSNKPYPCALRDTSISYFDIP
ncbi:MAG: hypothetical protein ACFCVD_02865 [Nodosilinea sp.]